MKVFPPGNEEKVLGIVWNSKTDTLSLKVKSDLMKLSTIDHQSLEEIKLKKRLLLGEVARIYDLLGVAAAFTIRAKIGMQDLWRMGVDWDDKLSLQQKMRWRQLFNELSELENSTFKRCPLMLGAAEPPLLCVFSDA